MEENQLAGLRPEQFGPLLPFVENDQITDINWANGQLVVDDVGKGRYRVEEVHLSDQFLNQFESHVGNIPSVNANLTSVNPVMEAEGNGLRIEIVHESASVNGKTISIRKSLPYVKLTDESMIEDHYCTKEMQYFLKSMVLAQVNIAIAGLVGAGKTELLKYLTLTIPPMTRVVTIEDNLEVHYSKLNQGKDCVELKVNPSFSYVDALVTCLRLRTDWILLSEARSTEAKYLIENISTGNNCITTLHSDDARKIPVRLRNMMDDSLIGEKMESDTYSYLNLGIYVRRKMLADGHIIRRIEQIVCFGKDQEDRNVCQVLVDDGKLISRDLTEEIEKKLKRVGIQNPFKDPYPQIEEFMRKE